MGAELARLKPGFERAVQHDFRLAAGGVGNFAVAPAHGHLQPQANGLAESLLGGKTRRQEAHAALWPGGAALGPGGQFGVAEDFLGEALAVARQAGAYAPHIANVGADAVNHPAAGAGVGAKASPMQRR